MTAESVLNGPPPGPFKSGLEKRLRPIWLGIITLLVILKIVVLSPAPLEQTGIPPRSINLDELVLKEQNTLAPGIPQGKVPDYTIDQFNYVSTHAGEKQWNLMAQEAFLFNQEKLMHGRNVHANLYDSEGKITMVTGLEAKYLTNQSDLEVYGNVETTFPDGFVVHSEYMRYKPKERKVEIPVSYPASGQGKEQGGQTIHFTSQGLNFDMETSDIYLPQDVKFVVDEEKTQTVVVSDHCLIHRKINLADFSMDEKRSPETRFVEIDQPTMHGRGRTAKLVYGSAPHTIQNMTLFDDTLVKEFKIEKGVKTLSRYGTGGRADFDSKKNQIILTIYPQAYQDDDDLTGDRIIMHRDSDIVEVEHSNAFSTGSKDDDSDSKDNDGSHP